MVGNLCWNRAAQLKLGRKQKRECLYLYVRQPQVSILRYILLISSIWLNPVYEYSHCNHIAMSVLLSQFLSFIGLKFKDNCSTGTTSKFGCFVLFFFETRSYCSAHTVNHECTLIHLFIHSFNNTLTSRSPVGNREVIMKNEGKVHAWLNFLCNREVRGKPWVR